MKIYFAGSIRGGREDAAVYFAMIAFLRNFGEVMTEHVGDLELTEKGDDGPNDRFIHDRDMAWLQVCDLVVAEVTKPSLGVGYELGWAAAWHKPTLCLFCREAPGSLSAMIAGSSALETATYSDLAEAKEQMTAFITNHSLTLPPSSAAKDKIK
ncbi:MAG: nucleoside 2-deoxyribosyltransferase [Proteobacteria bacterium]|nr:nucleoside 2-deoxyribosyltransferase [Pseudomonadota bacterium]MBU1714662.1 nucleoside 2-deoxyribosyltransferase [Pseudomonadota bacterium]